MNFTGNEFLTEKHLIDLGLYSDQLGYYEINEDLTIDVEGDIRYEVHPEKCVWICKIRTIEELKLFIEFTER